jgi:hypothetical protein
MPHRTRPLSQRTLLSPFREPWFRDRRHPAVSSAGTPTTTETPAGPPASAKPTPARTAPSATPSPASRPWPRLAFARLSFEAPPGWALVTHGANACLEPVHRAGLPEIFGCAGLDIKSGSIPGNELRPYEAGQPGGWYAATDVQPCPVRPYLADGSLNGITSGTSAVPVTTGFRPVGSHRAAYDRWEAVCRSGYRFAPQAWYLPVSGVLFLDYTGHPETSRVLASVRFQG